MTRTQGAGHLGDKCWLEEGRENSSRQEASLQTFIVSRAPAPRPESHTERDSMQGIKQN